MIASSHTAPPTTAIKTLLQTTPPGKLLDIGAGTGRNTLFAAQNGWNVTATDISATALTELRKSADEAGIQRKIKTLNQPMTTGVAHAYYDLVVCNMVLHYCRSKKELSLAVESMKKGTRSGGLNYLSAFTESALIGVRPYLFQDNEILGLYSDWKIVLADIRPSTPLQVGTPPLQFNYMTTVVLAQK